MNENNHIVENEASRQFAKIWDDYNNPVMIEKKEQEKKEQEILIEKKSKFNL